MLYIGPHVSIASSIALSPERAKALGATGFAIFTKNQRQWKSPELREDEVIQFKNSIVAMDFDGNSILPHAGYLINPATPDAELRVKSLNLFLEEASRVTRLGIDLINIHPGAYKEGDRKDGIKRCADMLDEVLARFPGLRIAVENTAGAGTILGSSFEELDEIISSVSNSDRLGFTLDTAHLFGAGYDVKNDADKVLDEFFSRFSREKLFGMHLNDSKVPLASNKDRHDNIGMGLIGKEAFFTIVRRKEVEGIPLILETPNEELWADEIKELQDANKR